LTPYLLSRFHNVTAITLDAVANVLYATDTQNQVVRVITLGPNAAATLVTTLAGGGPAGFGVPNNIADGTAANATFKWPMGIALVNVTSSMTLSSGRSGQTVLLVSEAAGNRLRLVNNTDGSVRTVAGGSLGSTGFVDGVGVGAMLYAPTGIVAVSPVAGSTDTTFAVVLDSGNHALRRVAAAQATVFTLEAQSNGTADNVMSYNDTYNRAMYPFTSWSVQRLPGGLASDLYDEMLFGDETQTVSWCSYSGGGEGTLVLRGAMQAQLYRTDNGTTSTLVLTWQGVRATDVRVVPLARFASPQDDPCSDSVADGMRSYGSCLSVDASDSYAATLIATCTAATLNMSGTSIIEALPSGSGYSLDGPALHVSNDEYAFVGGMYAGESHVVNVTLRRGARYVVRAWGAVNVTLAGATDGVVLFSASLNGTSQQQVERRVVAPALGGCMNPNAANYNPNALSDDGSCVAPGLPAQVSLSAAAGIPTPDTWFSFGVFLVGGAGDDDLASPVVLPQRFAAANQTAVLVPPLAPGLYYIEMYGNVSGTIQLYEPPDLPSALVLDAPGGLSTWDYTPVGSHTAAPLISFNASSVVPVFANGYTQTQTQFTWGVQFDAVPTNLDPYGSPLPGGAVRAYFSVPSRPSSHAFFTAIAGGAVAVPTAHVTAAAWVPPAALGAPSVSLRAAALTNLTATSAPPLSLGRVVSDIYALLPLDSTTPALAKPLTMLLPYDTQDADAVTGALGPYDAGASLVVITASDASGQDWHVLPNATFLNGLAVFSVSARGVFAVSTSVVLIASLPPFASSNGGTRILMAGLGVSPGSQALCRFGADAGVFAAGTLPPPPSTTGGFIATLACVVPTLPENTPPPLWVTLQFFSADALSVSAGASVEGISVQTPLFLFAAPPRVLTVMPARVSTTGGAVLHVTGDLLAPPASDWHWSGQPSAFADAPPWMCATSGFTLGSGASTPAGVFVQAAVVSSALALCEVPMSRSTGNAALVVGATGTNNDVAPFPDGTPGLVTYAAAVVSATVAAGSSVWVSAPWGGDLLEAIIAGASAQQQTAFRIGTIIVSVRSGRTPQAVQAIAPATAATLGVSAVSFTLTGLAPGEMDIPVDSLPRGMLATVAAPQAMLAYPDIVLAGQDMLLTVAVHSAIDVAGDIAITPLASSSSFMAWLCVLDGASSSRVADAGMGAVTCQLPGTADLAGGPVHSLSLRGIASSAASDAVNLRARSALATHVHIVALPAPRVTAVYPDAIFSGGGTLLWLRGANLLASPSHAAAVQELCTVTNRASGYQTSNVAVAMSTAVMACEAPTGGDVEFQASVQPTMVDAATGQVLARGSTLQSVDLRGQIMPLLQLVAPPMATPLPDAGGVLVTLHGAAHADSLAELSCAFGTISGIAPAVRSGDTFSCIAPARAPSDAVSLQLDAHGGWSSGSPPLATLSFAQTPSAEPQVLSSNGARVSIVADAAMSGALACVFDAAAMPAVLQAASGDAPGQLLTCMVPLPALRDPPLRFVALRIARAAALSVSGSQGPELAGESVAFEYAWPPPRLTSTQPEVAPLWGGALISISGSGFRPGGDSTWCTFAFPGISAFEVPGAAESSTRMRCEAPALMAPIGDALVTVVVLSDRYTRAAFTAVALPSVTQQPVTLQAVPAVGNAGGGTRVEVAGSYFTTAGLPLQCQVRVSVARARIPLH